MEVISNKQSVSALANAASRAIVINVVSGCGCGK